MTDFQTRQLGQTGLTVRALGLSASYWPSVRAIHHAIDRGVNLFFLYGIDRQMVKALRSLSPSEREKLVIVSAMRAFGDRVHANRRWRSA